MVIVTGEHIINFTSIKKKNRLKQSPIKGVEWLRGLQEDKVPRFRDDTG